MVGPRGSFTIPMVGSDGWVRVPLSVMGQTARAVVDTGAFPELCVPYAEAKKKRIINGAEPKVYPHGDAQDCMLRRPLPFQLGRWKFQADKVLAWGRRGLRDAEDPIKYILGLKFLLRFKTEFDFVQRRVTFHSLTSSPQKQWRRVQIIPFQNHCEQALLIPGAIKGVAGWFFWDTGAPEVYLSPCALKLLGHRVHWGTSELANVYGRCRQTGPFPLALTLSGFVRGDGDVRGIALRTTSARAIDAPGDRDNLEQGAGRRLFGLMNVNLCGAARLLIDPQRCILWRVPRN